MGKRLKMAFFPVPVASRYVKRCSIITNHHGNANPDHSMISCHPVRMAMIKRQELASVGKDVEKSKS